jgi:hypothetical protein
MAPDGVEINRPVASIRAMMVSPKSGRDGLIEIKK